MKQLNVVCEDENYLLSWLQITYASSMLMEFCLVKYDEGDIV